MARALTITNKACTLSKRFTGSKMRSADKEGDEGGDAGEFEPGRKYKFAGIKVTEAFAMLISGNPGIFNFLFNYGPEKKITGPASERVGPITINEKFKQCAVEIAWGLQNKDSQVAVTNARIGAIKLYADGTACRMDCDMQGLFPMTIATLRLEQHSGDEVFVWIKFGATDESEGSDADKQRDLIDEQEEEQEEESEETEH